MLSSRSTFSPLILGEWIATDPLGALKASCKLASEQGFHLAGPHLHRGRMSNGYRLYETGGLIRRVPSRPMVMMHHRL